HRRVSYHRDRKGAEIQIAPDGNRALRPARRRRYGDGIIGGPFSIGRRELACNDYFPTSANNRSANSRACCLVVIVPSSCASRTASSKGLNWGLGSKPCSIRSSPVTIGGGFNSSSVHS